MDIFNVASALFGSSRVEETDGISNAINSISAVGATDSESGNVGLTMDADITPADDVEGDETIFEVPTSPAVAAGDDVVMGLTGNGPLKVPIVLANPGSGDRMAASISHAESIAEQAEAVAQATGQHFWYDEGGDGAHVTQVTREEWEGGTQTGPNSLWNAQGMLFRDGSNDLLALLPAQRHSETFTGDGTTTAFTLSRTPTSVTSVTIPGVTYAEGTDYTVSGSTITFATAPANGATVTVRYAATLTDTFSGDGSTTAFHLTGTPDSVSTVTLDGIEVPEMGVYSVPFSHSLSDMSYWMTIYDEQFTLLGDGWAHFAASSGADAGAFIPYMEGAATGDGEYTLVVEIANCSSSAAASIRIGAPLSWDTTYMPSNAFTLASSALANGTYTTTITAKSDQSNVRYLFWGYIDASANTSTSFDIRVTLYGPTDPAAWSLSGETLMMLPAPASGGVVAVSYDGTLADELSGDGTTTAFALTTAPSEVEFVGVPDEDVTGYTLSNKTLTLPSAPYDGAELVVDYKTSQSSVTIFDGDGNGEDNITSVFSEDYVRIGGKVPVESDIGGSGASIEFFDQTNTHTSRMNAFTSIVENTDFYDMRNETSIATSLDDNGRVVDTDSNGTASLQLKQELSYGLTDVGEQTSEVTSAIVADATYDADGTNPVTSHAAVRAVALTGSGHSTGYSVVDIVAEQGIGIGTGDVGLLYVSTPQVVCALLQPEATYTGDNTTATASSNGWTISRMNNVQGSSNVAGYFTFSNGVITALRDELLEISGVAYWTSGAVGQYGFGIFIGSSTVGSGTEKSVFGYKASASGQFSVVMPPRCVPVSAGTQIAVGRYSISGSVYRNGANYSWITIRVIEDRSS